jgi:hypothetical protein
MVNGTRRTTGLAGFFAAVFVPPAVAAGLGQSFVTQHPALAIAIWLAYEGIVAVAGFFAHIADDLFTIWRQPIVAHLDRSVRRQGRRYEKRYLEVTLAGLKKIEQKDLTIVGDFTPSLDAVFRRVALVSRPPQDIQSGVLLGLASEQAERPGISDLLGREEPRVLAVVGAPGSGKTETSWPSSGQSCGARRGMSPLTTFSPRPGRTACSSELAATGTPSRTRRSRNT